MMSRQQQAIDSAVTVAQLGDRVRSARGVPSHPDQFFPESVSGEAVPARIDQ
jgi:hypothetical protein